MRDVSVNNLSVETVEIFRDDSRVGDTRVGDFDQSFLNIPKETLSSLIP